MPRQKCTVKSQVLQEILKEVAQEANEKCQFSQRKRECGAEIFVQTLVLGWLEKPGASVEQLTLVAKELECKITKQGLDKRINKRAVMFLAYVLSESMRRLRLVQALSITILEQFAGVYITDSTQVKLPDVLYGEFKGNEAPYSVIKWQVTIEYLSGTLVDIKWGDGKSSDQKCTLPVDWALKDSLHLFDLGYFKQGRFSDIAKEEAYFVSRHKVQTAIYDPDTGERILLHQYLKTSARAEVEFPCLLGQKDKVRVRLIAYRLSEKEAARRRRKAKKKARKQGQANTKIYLQLLGWEILITNLSAEVYTPALIFEFYGIRWQIELVFKTWKSQMKIATIGNWRPERVLCQLYAILIACVLCHWWVGNYRWWKQGEQSITRMIQTIQRYVPKILRCIVRKWRGIRQIFKQVEGDFLRFARKGKRKKSPSTLQILINWDLS